MSNSHETLTDPTTGKPRISWLAWLLWLTTLAGLYLIRHDVEKRDAEIQRSQKALTLLIERVGKTMSPLDSNKRVAAVAVQEANLLPEASNIEDALRLAEKSKSAGNTELALVYLANAIRSQPRDIHVLSKYTTWALDSKNPTVIQGAENLLQGALYGVSAKDVLEVTGRLEEVSKALAVQQAPLDAPSGHDLEPAKSFAELEKVTLESFSGDRKKIETRIEALSVVVEQINEADQPDSKLKDQVGQRLAEAQAYAMADQVLSLAELRFNNLAATETLVATEPSDNNRTAALAALQATEAAVN